MWFSKVKLQKFDRKFGNLIIFTIVLFGLFSYKKTSTNVAVVSFILSLASKKLWFCNKTISFLATGKDNVSPIIINVTDYIKGIYKVKTLIKMRPC